MEKAGMCALQYRKRKKAVAFFIKKQAFRKACFCYYSMYFLIKICFSMLFQEQLIPPS